VIRRAIVWLLIAGGLLSSGGMLAAEAGEPVFTKATDILAMAEKAVQAEDKAARIIRAEYHWGRADLTFRSGEFVFNIPRLKNEGGKRSSMRISIRDGKMKGVEKELQHWVEFDPPDPDPTKAFAAAGSAGLSDWLAKNKTAGLSMELILWSKSMPFKRGPSPWVWRVRGWGPDVPKEYEIYLDAGKLDILGGKSASKADAGGKAVAPKKPDESAEKPADATKPKPDDDGKADESKKSKSDNDDKADDTKQPKPDGDGKTDDSQKPKPVDDGKAGKSNESDSGKEKQPDKFGIKDSETLVPKLGIGDLRKSSQ
jgi:hypothetical protein